MNFFLYLSRTVKSLRLHHSYKLTSYPASVTWMLADNKEMLGRGKKDSFILTAIAVTGVRNPNFKKAKYFVCKETCLPFIYEGKTLIFKSICSNNLLVKTVQNKDSAHKTSRTVRDPLVNFSPKNIMVFFDLCMLPPSKGQYYKQVSKKYICLHVTIKQIMWLQF